jgi:hypothetical protein
MNATSTATYRLRPIPALIFAARHPTFLVSAVAIALADRVLGIQYHEERRA